MVCYLNLIRFKLSSEPILPPPPGSCFTLVDFILKSQELNGWEHDNTVMTLILMSGCALQGNKWEYGL